MWYILRNKLLYSANFAFGDFVLGDFRRLRISFGDFSFGEFEFGEMQASRYSLPHLISIMVKQILIFLHKLHFVKILSFKKIMQQSYL